MHQGQLKTQVCWWSSTATAKLLPWVVPGWQGGQPWKQPELSLSMGAVGKGALQGTFISAFASCAQAVNCKSLKGADLRLNPTTFQEQNNGMLQRDEVQVKTGPVK